MNESQYLKKKEKYEAEPYVVIWFCYWIKPHNKITWNKQLHNPQVRSINEFPKQ